MLLLWLLTHKVLITTAPDSIFIYLLFCIVFGGVFSEQIRLHISLESSAK